MGRLNGKVAFITGAASGIGAATARLFAREGAKVAIADIRGEMAEATAAKIRAEGGDVIAITTDVTDSAQVKASVDRTVSTYGKLDILFSNAGVLMPDTVESDSDASWHQSVSVNLTGNYLCCRHAIPELKKNGGGAIVITSSISGMLGEKMSASYNTTKGALINLTRHLAIEYAGDRIRVNCVCPGWVDTPFNNPIYEMTDLEKESVGETIPLGRQGEPEEIAAAVLFLASDEASYVTGHALVVDGGVMAQ